MSRYADWLTEEGLILLEGWARRGLTDKQIAENAGIGARTLGEWKVKFPQIRQALKKGKEISDIHVENALFKKACGYRTTEISYKADENGKLIPVSAVEKDVPPDTTAQIYWLKNRRPDLWRERRKEVDADAQSGGVVVLPEVVAEAIKAVPPQTVNSTGEGDENG